MEQNENNLVNLNNININVVTGYCSECLKDFDDIDKSDKKYIVKDINGNEFCCRECMNDYLRCSMKEIESIVWDRW